MFNRTLIESNRRTVALKTKWYLGGVASFTLHGAAALALLVAWAWGVDEVPEPRMYSVFLQPEPPAPPPPPPARKETPTKPSEPVRVERQEVVSEPVQPVEVPAELPPEAPPEDLAAGSGEDWGVEDGVVGGVPGGVRTSTFGAPEPDENEIFVVTPEIIEPKLIHRVEPDYPIVAQRIGKQGLVVLRAIINQSGEVEQVAVLRSQGAILDAAAVEAVRQWKYTPATLDGRRIKVYLTVTVDSRLD